jgi:heme-degrading monooxygenase HmoA
MVIVLFQARLREGVDRSAYEATFERMLGLASAMPGFIGIEGFAGEDGDELAVVRFASEDTLAAWKNHPDHVAVQQEARASLYESYHITVTSLVREYGFPDQ